MALGVQKSVIVSAVTDFYNFARSLWYSLPRLGLALSDRTKPEINSRAADEIALAEGGVKEPVGFRNDTQICHEEHHSQHHDFRE